MGGPVQHKSLTLRGASFYKVGADGLVRDRPPQSNHNLIDYTCDVDTIMVHGFRWNIEGVDNPHVQQFARWCTWLNHERVSLGMAWNSWPSFCEAWKRDRVHTYHRAWDVAGKLAAPGLRKLLFPLRHPVNLVCHSLGSRVILQALRRWPDAMPCPVQRVLILNGAETAHAAREVAEMHPDIAFYNVGTRNDRILKYLGGVFTPGHFYEPTVGLHGFGGTLPNVHQWWLDSRRVQNWAEKLGWDLDGSGWFGTRGHHTSMTHEGNWPLYRAILNNQPVPEMRIR